MQTPLISFAGNHLGDDVRVANVFDFESRPKVADGTTKVVAASSSAGVLTAPFGLMKFIPLIEPGIADGTEASLVVQQLPVAGGLLPIRGLPSGVTAEGYYLSFVQSKAMIQLDVPRSIILGVQGTTSASTAFNLYVTGADFWGQLVTVTFAVAAGVVADVVYDLKKSLKYIYSARVSAATGAPIWLGVGSTFGMDYYTPDNSNITRASYNGTSLNINTGGVFEAPPALNATPTATSNDVRGAIAVPALTADGILNVQYVIEGATAQAGYNYVPPSATDASGFWVQAPNGSNQVGDPAVFVSGRVMKILGAAQFYDPTLA